MNREAVEKWADALQFGDRPQIRGDLRGWTEGGKDGFCGLGVACDVYAEIHGLPKSSPAYEDLFEPVDADLTPEVSKWLDISPEEAAEIIKMNDRFDDPLTLPEIGSWIRDNWIKDE